MITRKHMNALAGMFNSMLLDVDRKYSAVYAQMDLALDQNDNHALDGVIDTCKVMLEQFIGARMAIDELIGQHMSEWFSDQNERFDVGRWSNACYDNVPFRGGLAVAHHRTDEMMRALNNAN